jgi:hypothetical protein
LLLIGCVALGSVSTGRLVETVEAADAISNRNQATRVSDLSIATEGYVVIDGRYLTPPYSVEQRGNELFVSGKLIPTDGLRLGVIRTADFSRRTQGGEGAGNRTRSNTRNVDRITRMLDEGAMLIAWSETQSILLDAFDTATLLDVLLSESSPRRRSVLLDRRSPYAWITAEQWRRIAEQFTCTDELRERAGPLIDFYREDLDAAASQEITNPFHHLFASKPFSYGVIVSAMMLAVMATGNLLNVRPEGQIRWSELNDSLENRQMVTRNVVLIGVLSVVDLLLTLSAHQTATLMELNPFGSQLVSTPATLAIFKLSTLAAVGVILFSLRRYRGAQVASWWMCLVCTILTFRWVTFNSLFIS